MEDVHRAGGIMAILGELDRAGKLHTDVPTVHAKTMKDALDKWDIARQPSAEVQALLQRRTLAACLPRWRLAKPARWPSLDVDRAAGGAFAPAHTRFRKKAGLAVLARQHCSERLCGQDRRRGRCTAGV
jgi:dihydroxy-acid dehydratase